MPPLSILIWLPALTGLVCALLPAAARDASTEQSGEHASWSAQGIAALTGTLAALGLAIGYIADYKTRGGLQHVTDVVWISELGIHYKVAVSGLNLFLVGLTTLLFAMAILASNMRTWERPRLFYFQFLLAESAVLGAFLAQDLALFVAFFDLMLIPFYFLIGGWGREPDRIRATIKLVIYTLVGSLLMLAAAVATGVLASQRSAGTSPSCSPRCSSSRSAPAPRSGSSCSSPRRSWSRCLRSRCTAGCPTGTARCRSRF